MWKNISSLKHEESLIKFIVKGLKKTIYPVVTDKARLKKEEEENKRKVVGVKGNQYYLLELSKRTTQLKSKCFYGTVFQKTQRFI